MLDTALYIFHTTHRHRHCFKQNSKLYLESVGIVTLQ